MSIYTLGPLIGSFVCPISVIPFLMISKKGPVVGPIAGGYIVQTVGIKYIFITIAGQALLASIIRVPLPLHA